MLLMWITKWPMWRIHQPTPAPLIHTWVLIPHRESNSRYSYAYTSPHRQCSGHTAVHLRAASVSPFKHFWWATFVVSYRWCISFIRPPVSNTGLIWGLLKHAYASIRLVVNFSGGPRGGDPSELELLLFILRDTCGAILGLSVIPSFYWGLVPVDDRD